MTKNNRQTIGSWGESLAKDYLLRQGYKILATNCKTSYKEIDIIALQGDDLVFVEVKTRTSLAYGDGSEAVGHHKQRHLRAAIAKYLHDKKLWKKEARCDLILILFNRFARQARLRHYQDIL